MAKDAESDVKIAAHHVPLSTVLERAKGPDLARGPVGARRTLPSGPTEVKTKKITSADSQKQKSFVRHILGKCYSTVCTRAHFGPCSFHLKKGGCKLGGKCWFQDLKPKAERAAQWFSTQTVADFMHGRVDTRTLARRTITTRKAVT